MKKSFFQLSIKENKENEKCQNNFSIENNKLINEEFDALYKFDKIFYLEEYNEKEEFNKEENITYIIYGPSNSGKSTLLRGEKQIVKNDLDDENSNIGMILSKLNIYYNQMFDKIEKKEDLIVLKFGCFCSDLEDDSIFYNLIESKFNLDNIPLKNYFDDIIIPLEEKNKNSNNYFYIKHISSFKHLEKELEKVIENKGKIIGNKKDYSILYHFSIELKSNENLLKSIYKTKINFYEINTNEQEKLQPYLISINNKSNIEDENLNTTINENMNCFVNILCLKNLDFTQENLLNYLKIERFLECTFERDDLYNESSELCEHCFELNTQLIQDIKEKENILNQINSLTDEAQKIYSIILGMKKYKKKTQKNKNKNKINNNKNKNVINNQSMKSLQNQLERITNKVMEIDKSN